MTEQERAFVGKTKMNVYGFFYGCLSSGRQPSFQQTSLSTVQSFCSTSSGELDAYNDGRVLLAIDTLEEGKGEGQQQKRIYEDDEKRIKE